MAGNAPVERLYERRGLRTAMLVQYRFVAHHQVPEAHERSGPRRWSKAPDRAGSAIVPWPRGHRPVRAIARLLSVNVRPSSRRPRAGPLLACSISRAEGGTTVCKAHVRCGTPPRQRHAHPVDRQACQPEWDGPRRWLRLRTAAKLSRLRRGSMNGEMRRVRRGPEVELLLQVGAVRKRKPATGCPRATERESRLTTCVWLLVSDRSSARRRKATPKS